MQYINTAATILNAIFISLGVTFFVLLMVGWQFNKATKEKIAEHKKFRYLKVKCNICGLEMFGSTQVSLNKTFYWHATNKHPDAI